MIRRPPTSALFPYTSLFRFINQIFEGLVGLRQGSTVVKPLLATGWSEIGRAHVWTPVTLIYLLCRFLFVNDTATTDICPLSLHVALQIYKPNLRGPRGSQARVDGRQAAARDGLVGDRKSTRLDSSHTDISPMPLSVCE